MTGVVVAAGGVELVGERAAVGVHGAILTAAAGAYAARPMTPFTLTVRRRGTTDRARFDTLAEALDALEAHLDGLAQPERRRTERGLGRDYEPARQVAVRGEVAGPRRLRAGVDLRGDGSAEAFTGRWRRQLIERRAGETAYDALRRALGGAA
jgi:hypothetical protein